MKQTLPLLVIMSLVPATAAAGDWTDKVKFSGFLQGDLRFNIDDYRGPVKGEGYNFSMNRNDLDLRLEVLPAERVTAVIETRLRYFGFNEAGDLPALSSRQKIDPYDVRLEEAYLAVKGFLWKRADLKAGRIIQSWGSADMFNPTDNLNARDFSDPLDYAAKVPNQMIELDLYPTDWLTLNAVWVPVFKPSMLPASASLGFDVSYDQNGCLSSFPVPPLSKEDNKALTANFPESLRCQLRLIPNVRTVTPGTSFSNSQAALRARVKAGDVDLALSYYYGRFSFPVPFAAYAEMIQPGSGVPGLDPNKVNVAYQAELMFPRMQVAGVDFSYSAPWLFDIGFIGELALIFPEEVLFAARVPDINAPDKRLTYTHLNVPKDPFIKATAGVDYTFTRWLYVNAMYVRGFFDEFNDVYGIHNYGVLTTELKFKNDEVVLRLTGMLNLDDASNVVYPQVTWIVVPSVELVLGAFIFGGDTSPRDPLNYAAKDKFGQKATGRDVAFFKTKVTW